MGCHWDVIGMLLGCYWDVIGMLLGCYWDVIGMLYDSDIQAARTLSEEAFA
jgi:hypothetical protein